jgi:hypothetical protein
MVEYLKRAGRGGVDAPGCLQNGIREVAIGLISGLAGGEFACAFRG